MHVLVAYASRHGATEGIAARIADTLRTAGLEVDLREVSSVKDLGRIRRVRRRQRRLHVPLAQGGAGRSSGTIERPSPGSRRGCSAAALWGPRPSTPTASTRRSPSVPKEMPELMASIGACEHRVFFGAIERGRKPIGLAERLTDMMPVARDNLPYGDLPGLARDRGLGGGDRARPHAGPRRLTGAGGRAAATRSAPAGRRPVAQAHISGTAMKAFADPRSADRGAAANRTVDPANARAYDPSGGR